MRCAHSSHRACANSDCMSLPACSPQQSSVSCIKLQAAAETHVDPYGSPAGGLQRCVEERAWYASPAWLLQG